MNHKEYRLGFVTYVSKRIHYFSNNVTKYIFKVYGGVKFLELVIHVYTIITCDDYELIRNCLRRGQSIRDKIVIVEYNGCLIELDLNVKYEIGWTFNDKNNQTQQRLKFIKFSFKKFSRDNNLSLADVIRFSRERFLFSYNLTIKVVDKSTIRSRN